MIWEQNQSEFDGSYVQKGVFIEWMFEHKIIDISFTFVLLYITTIVDYTAERAFLKLGRINKHE